MQTRYNYTNFSIWDDELDELITNVSNQSALSITKEELTEWFHKRGGDIYNITESITIRETMKAALNKKGHYPEFTMHSIIGVVTCSLEDLYEEFINHFAKEEHTEEILSYFYNQFQVKAIKFHKPFYNLRAEITSSLNDYYKSKMKSKEPTDERSYINELLIKKLEFLQSLPPQSPSVNDSNTQLIEDIQAYMEFVRIFDLTVDTLTPETRKRVLPVLPPDSKSLNSQTRSNSVSQRSPRNNSPHSFLRNLPKNATSSSHDVQDKQLLDEPPLRHSSSLTFERPPALKT